MNCEQARKDELGEKYLLEQLSEAQRDAYEIHCLSCGECFAELQTYRALRARLRASAESIRAAPAARQWWAFDRRWALAAGLAVIVLGTGLGLWVGREGAPSRATIPSPPGTQFPATILSLAELARVDPPPYAPTLLRGSADAAVTRFQAAMEKYRAGDYAGAAAALRASVEIDPSLAPAHFYLGISGLMTTQTDLAIDHLKSAAAEDSPLREQARYYLAKAYLRQGDIRAAIAELNVVTERGGPLSTEAARLRGQLGAARGLLKGK